MNERRKESFASKVHHLNTVVISNKLGIFNNYNSPFENPHLRIDASILKRRVERKEELELFASDYNSPFENSHLRFDASILKRRKEELELFAFKSVPVIIHVII